VGREGRGAKKIPSGRELAVICAALAVVNIVVGNAVIIIVEDVAVVIEVV